jgi:acyl-CoA synthetase (AMP-forming)/AMP-acid ligase II
MIPPELKTVNNIYAHFIKNTLPDVMVLGQNERAITLGELQKGVDNYTRQLIALGIQPGAVVGYTLPNCPEVFYIFLAISRLGGCALPMFPMTPDRVKADVFKKAQARLVVTTAAQLGPLQEAAAQIGAEYPLVTLESWATPADIDLAAHSFPVAVPQQPLLLTTSSGTTGIPKSVLLTQGNIASEIRAAGELATPFNLNDTGTYTTLMAFPLSTAALIVTLGMLFARAPMIFSSDLSPVKFLQLLTYWQVNNLAAPPSYYEAILQLPILDQFDLRSVKRVTTGMDFFSPSLRQRLLDRFVNVNSFANGYGLIETSDVIMVCKAANVEEFTGPGNVMQLIENVGNMLEVRDENGQPVLVGGEGELFFKGPNVVNGYLGNPTATAESFVDGWLKTGDIARYVGPGQITLLGRRKYLIKRGGKSVSPVVVQNHINELPGVKDSAVVGVPQPLYGEMVWAFIVRAENSAIELKDVMRHCRAELPNYMAPDQVSFIPEIPKHPGVGKVNLEKLKEIAANDLAATLGQS